MKPKEAYNLRPIFSQYGGYKNFPSRLRSARNQEIAKINRNASDEQAFAHDRNLFPIVACNARGLLRWGGSNAENLLRQDISNGRHYNLSPKELHNSREEYQNFPLDRFRDHIHQEVRRRKFLAQYASKDN
jgi:hypothetical protein